VGLGLSILDFGLQILEGKAGPFDFGLIQLRIADCGCWPSTD